MKSLSLILIGSALVYCGSAYAQEQGTATGEQRGQRMELHKQHRAQSKEMKAEHRAKRATQRMQMVDTNKDGKLDLTEYLQNAEQRFSDMDLDSDGYVTTDEAGDWRKEMRSEHKQAMKAAYKANKKSAVEPTEK